GEQFELLTLTDGQGGDVVEQNDGVDAESSGAQRGGGGQLGVLRELVETQVSTKPAKLGIPTAGLPHRPNRRPLDRFTATGANKQKIVRTNWVQWKRISRSAAPTAETDRAFTSWL